MSAVALMVPDDDRSIDNADLVAMSNEELRAELARCLGITAANLRRLAGIVATLESRGEDLSSLRLSVLHDLRRIACGQVLPEVVVRFMGAPHLRAIVGSLPLADQRRLADGGAVRVVVPTPSGTTSFREVDPAKLTKEQVRQVFARDHIRNEEEQSLFLDQQRVTARRRGPEVIGDMRLDYERVGAKIGRHFVPLSDLAAVVATLKKATGG